MHHITISMQNHETFSAISNTFIDFYMTHANGEFVKVYLYLVRIMNSEQNVSIAAIADHFDLTENDICRAIRYWVKQKALQLDYNENKELCGITILPLSPMDMDEVSATNDLLSFVAPEKTVREEVKAVKPVKEEAKPVKATISAVRQDLMDVEKQMPKEKHVPAKIDYSNVTMNQWKHEDPVFETIVYELETIFATELTSTDLQSLLYIYDGLHFSQDLIEYLIEYCATNDKRSLRYMEAVAVKWYQKGIMDISAAKEENELYNTVYLSILKTLGIQRSKVTDAERQYIDSWKNELHFSQDVILEACKRAILANPNKVNFPYVNGILENWSKSDVKTIDDVEKQEQIYIANKKKNISKNSASNNQFNQFNQSDNDQELDEIQRLLSESLNG